MTNEPTKDTNLPSCNGSLETLLSEHKAGKARKLYKAQADEHKAEALQKDITTKTALLCNATAQKAVNFNDLEAVQERTLEYLNACANTGSFPSMMGLASYGFGVSRQALYWHLKNHPETETARFIDRVRDLIADVLSSAALQRNADSIMSIFILKNGLGFSDRVEIEPIPQQMEERQFDKAELLKRYLAEE